ncbi:hypothetical protein CBFG_01011 [Clostridiales bacterium 1_7_47FAA]|nr:hypothetical protein CBFG_01011 [Clostridiales bacterium 1_7_47FAA]
MHPIHTVSLLFRPSLISLPLQKNPLWSIIGIYSPILLYIYKYTRRYINGTYKNHTRLPGGNDPAAHRR